MYIINMNAVQDCLSEKYLAPNLLHKIFWTQSIHDLWYY